MIDPPIPPVDDVAYGKIEVNKDAETIDDKTKDTMGDNVVMPKKLKPIQRFLPPFRGSKRRMKRGCFRISSLC